MPAGFARLAPSQSRQSARQPRQGGSGGMTVTGRPWLARCPFRPVTPRRMSWSARQRASDARERQDAVPLCRRGAVQPGAMDQPAPAGTPGRFAMVCRQLCRPEAGHHRCRNALADTAGAPSANLLLNIPETLYSWPENRILSPAFNANLTLHALCFHAGQEWNRQQVDAWPMVAVKKSAVRAPSPTA